MNTEKGDQAEFDYAQNATATFTTAVNIRTSPSIHARIVGQYDAGESVQYDHVYIRDGYAWAGYRSYGGSRHYVALGQYPGDSYAKRSTQRTYTVQSGDTVSGIAQKLGVSYSKVALQFTNPNLIYPGEVVKY